MVMLGVFIVFIMGSLTLIVTLRVAFGSGPFNELWLSTWNSWGPSLLIFWGIAYILVLPGVVKDVMRD
jgi:uncharacterized membrane protein